MKKRKERELAAVYHYFVHTIFGRGAKNTCIENWGKGLGKKKFEERKELDQICNIV